MAEKKEKAAGPIKDIGSMSGTDKAAAFLMAMGEEYAATIFAQMHDDEIREITQSMVTLGRVSASVIESLIAQFIDSFSNSGSVVGSFDNTERLLGKILDKDKVEGIMDEIRGPAGRTLWDKLGNVSEEMLANYLKNEYPQTVAVVLSKIKSDHSAKVLAMLPENFAMEVVMRMLRMEPVQKEVLADVEKTLRSEFMSNLARTSRRDPHESMAEIFNGFDRATESRFLAAVEERSADSAEKIKSLMFTFDDLMSLDAGGIQTILREVDKEKLAKALKGASDEMKDLFMSNMSERAAKIMKEDMETMGPVRVREVDESQTYIVGIAKALADKGEIVIADSSGEDELIY